MGLGGNIRDFIILGPNDDEYRSKLPVPEAHRDDSSDVIDCHLQVVWDSVAKVGGKR